MSAGTSYEKCEPNMTPLLDVVLQLVMFFMLCVNFVMEQVNEEVKLPEAIAAKALDRTTEYYHILNIDKKGITTIEGEVLDSPGKVKNAMKEKFELDKQRMQSRGKAADWEAGKGRSIVILRADKACNYKMVHDVMTACREAGYSEIQLRAIQSGSLGTGA